MHTSSHGRFYFPPGPKRLRILLTYDSITVPSTWELTSVSMRYSQGDGVNISPSSLVYCTHVYCTSVCVLYYVYGYLPWHGHVLPGTIIINIKCVNQIYLQG